MEQIIVITRCDLCRPEGSNYSLNPMFVDANGIGVIVQRGLYTGPLNKALKNGWVETEFGVMCPECVKESAEEGEEGDHGAGLDRLDVIFSKAND